MQFARNRAPGAVARTVLTGALAVLAASAMSTTARADAYLADWCFNVNGVNVATASCNQAPPAPMAANVNGSNFDTTLEPAANTLGSVIITLGPGSGQFALAYLDYDLNFPNTGSFSDFGSVVGTPPSGVTYQLQDPNSGDLFAAFAANALTNQNNVATPGRPPDICCDVAWALGVGGLDVPAGGQAIITFTVSTTAPPTGFYLEQTNVMPDGGNGEHIYLSETTQIEGTAAPEPGTLALLGGAAIAISLLRPHHTRRG